MPSFTPPFAAAPGEEEVERVICASLATDHHSIYATMEHIREHALRHNPAVGVHVALLYQSGWFLHWAEGPSTVVRALFQRIRLDRRHHSQNVVHHSRGRRLLMTPWSMMLSPATESSEDFGRRVHALREQLLNGSQFSPTSVIRQLIAPMRLPQAAHPGDLASFRRIGVCAAWGNGAFSMVRWLSEQHRMPLVSRRFAGEADLDSGSDYVDFLRGGEPCRVIAVARSNLAHGLRRALLQDWCFMVLIFSGEPKRDMALIERVSEAFQDLPLMPDLLAIAPDMETHAQMQRTATAMGLVCINGGLIPDYDTPALWQATEQHLAQLGTLPSSHWAVLEPVLGS
jgi:hypothetical protein